MSKQLINRHFLLAHSTSSWKIGKSISGDVTFVGGLLPLPVWPGSTFPPSTPSDPNSETEVVVDSGSGSPRLKFGA